MTADLTPAQAARLEDVERVARAMADIDGVDWNSELTARIGTRDWYLRYAVAAIDVMRGATDDGAIGRVLALAAEWKKPKYSVDLQWCANNIRIAIGAPATAEGDDRG